MHACVQAALTSQADSPFDAHVYRNVRENDKQLDEVIIRGTRAEEFQATAVMLGGGRWHCGSCSVEGGEGLSLCAGLAIQHCAVAKNAWTNMLQHLWVYVAASLSSHAHAC
jgi:hypothetical protein